MENQVATDAAVSAQATNPYHNYGVNSGFLPAVNQSVAVSNSFDPSVTSNSNTNRPQQISNPHISPPVDFYQLSESKFRPTKLYTQQILNADGTTKQSIVIVDMPEVSGGIVTSTNAEDQKHYCNMESANLGNHTPHSAESCKPTKAMQVDESQILLDSDCGHSSSQKQQPYSASYSPPVFDPPELHGMDSFVTMTHKTTLYILSSQYLINFLHPFKFFINLFFTH